MARFVFKGVAFVTGVRMIVEAETLAEAVAKVALEEGFDVDLDKVKIEYTWADLNSGVETK